MEYHVLLLMRVQEERTLGRGAQAILDAATHAGGVITAAAAVLGGAFLLLGFTSPLGLLSAIGLGIGFGVLLQEFGVTAVLLSSRPHRRKGRNLEGLLVLTMGLHRTHPAETTPESRE